MLSRIKTKDDNQISDCATLKIVSE